MNEIKLMHVKLSVLLFFLLSIYNIHAQLTNPPQRRAMFTKELIQKKFILSKEKFKQRIDLSRIDTNAIYITSQVYSVWRQEKKCYVFLRFFKDAVFFSGTYLTPPTNEQAEDLSYGSWRCYTFDKKTGNLVIEVPQVVNISRGSREFYFGEFISDSLFILGSVPKYPVRNPNLSPVRFTYVKRSIDFKNREYQWFPQRKEDLEQIKTNSECFLSYDEVWTSLKTDTINYLGGALDLHPSYPEIRESTANFEIRLYSEARLRTGINSMIKLACVNGHFVSTKIEYQETGAFEDSLKIKIISVKSLKCKEYEMYFIDSLRSLNFFNLTDMKREKCFQVDTIDSNGQQLIQTTSPQILDGVRYTFQFKLEQLVHTSSFINPKAYMKFCPENLDFVNAARIIELFESYFEEKN